jgi:rod shape-determining protein MreD
MRRTTLAGSSSYGETGPLRSQVTPIASTLFASALALLPIVSGAQLLPNFGLLALLSWRLLRPEMWTARVGLALGFAHDLITGGPLGLAMSLWTFLLLMFDFVDSRLIWRDYWIDWILAALAIGLASAFEWKVADLMGAAGPMHTILPHILISILCFPAMLAVVARLDRWRLRR